MKEKYKNIDNLFKQKFEDFKPEPPGHIWDNVKTNIPVYPKNNILSNYFTKIVISIIAIIAVFIAGYFIFNPFESSPDEKILSPTTNQTKTLFDTNNKDQVVEITEIKTEDAFAETENNIKNNYSENTEFETFDNNLSNNKIPIEKTTANNDFQKNQTNVPESNTDVLVQNNSDDLTQSIKIEEVKIETLSDNSENIALIKTEENNEIADNEIRKNDIYNTKYQNKYKFNPYFSIGAYITPELIFYPDDSIPNNQSYNFDVSVSYHFSNYYFIQSGLGISFSNDDGKYTIDYERYDYMGSYEDVYDVTFDTTPQGIIPIYHTKTVDVYDSVRHISISQTKNKYTYLQIPLLFGYNFSKNKMTYSVKGGPSLSVLLFDNIPAANLQDEYIKIISINQKIPIRIQTNWQFLVSFGFAYRFSDNFSFSMEPSLRYYIRSAYEKKYITTKHPFSVGLRTGVVYKF